MSRNNLNALALVVLAVATLLHGSAAQTRYVVGDSTGWTIAGASFYANWAANKTFTLGDSLVFNFTNGQHDVAKVTKSAYDGCNGANTLFTLMNSPVTVNLNETGEQYYICTFSGHCSAGQKLSINVGKASDSPAPQPSASGSPPPKTSPVPAPAPAPQSPTTPPPSPVPAPAPAPSTGPVTYTVGDSLGWTVPSNGAAAYTSWVSGKTFKTGDILVFTFQRNAHNVEEVTKDKFDSCNSTSPIATYSIPPVRVTLNKTGEQYFICGIPGHCNGGQKLALNVTRGGSTATSPSPSGGTPPPSSGATPSPSGSTTPPPSSPTNPSSPSPAGSVTPPPQDSGAESLGALAFSATTTLLSVAAAFFY